MAVDSGVSPACSECTHPARQHRGSRCLDCEQQAAEEAIRALLYRSHVSAHVCKHGVLTLHMVTADETGVVHGPSVLGAECERCAEYAQGYRAAVREMREPMHKVLDGIDRTETDTPAGWWETSTGAQFGAARLREIDRLLGVL